MYKYVFIFLLFAREQLMAQVKTPLPTKTQLAWHEMELYLNIHFGPGEFNPTSLDSRQWARVAKSSGAKGIIIAAKLPDGFCLWPSKYSESTVRQSSWNGGKGDVLKEVSRACRENGLKFGVSFSPGNDEDFVNMLREIFQNYGPIWELRVDGTIGGNPVNWQRFENTVRRLSPRTLIFSETGPDIRGAGNGNEKAGITNWNFTNTGSAGEKWIPVECNTDILSPRELFDVYLESVGRGTNLLINVSPGNDGLITPGDSANLAGFRQLRDESFNNNLLKRAMTFYQFTRGDLSAPGLEVRSFDSTATGYGINLQNFIVELPAAEKINCIVLREAIHLGQTISKFQVVLYNGKKIVGKIEGTTIGRKRIIIFEPQTITSFTVNIEDASGFDNVSGIAAYHIDEKLLDK